MKIIQAIVTIFLSLYATNTFGYSYEKRSIDSHIIHIVCINPKDYEAKIVKANNGNIGRETVSFMAQKSSADIAINGGFFQIGNQNDGQAVGTLVIYGKVHNIKKIVQPLVIIKNGIISINYSAPGHYKGQNISIISGIPMLINSGQIPEDLFKKESAFYTKTHARTALGVDSTGKVIIVVAEHYYTNDLTAITMGELQSLMQEKGQHSAGKYHKKKPGDITLNELKQILRDEFSPPNISAKGLTILELAKLMQNLGCKYAVNLDGGGSSTLWIEGKVINNTFGDQDEATGEKIERPVSNAIIFKKW